MHWLSGDGRSTAERGCAGEEMTKYTLILQLSALLVTPHHCECLGKKKYAKSVTHVEVFQDSIFRIGLKKINFRAVLASTTGKVSED